MYKGTVNTYAKIKSMRKLVWSNSSNNYSEMFQKKLFLDFWGNMCGGVQLADWNVTIEKLPTYFLATYLKLLATSVLPVGRLRLAVP